MKSSIRKFLLVYLMLLLTVAASLAALGNYYLDWKDINNNLDNRLSLAGLIFHAVVADTIDKGKLTSIQARLNHVPALGADFFNPFEKESYSNSRCRDQYIFQVWDENGHVILHSALAPAQPVTVKKTGFSNKIINGERWRVFASFDARQNLTYTVAEHYGSRICLARQITHDDILIILLLFPIFGISIWFILGYGLSSIKRVRDEVEQRVIENLGPVNLEKVPQEVQPLVDELNKLFLRLKQAFDREQRFAADAAHELRTPLAALKTQAQVALRTTNMQERQLQLQNVIAGVDRCTHVVQQLLTLSRMAIEATTLDEPVEIDIAKLAAEVISQLVPLALDKNIEIELIAEQANCKIMGNTAGLHAMIRNLIDNAIRYTPDKGIIKVYVSSTVTHIVLRITDTGPGIPPDLRSRVFERFFRVLGTNIQGSGLGLAIVQQIVKLHNGNVALGAPANGVGLEVEVSLPKIH